MTDATGGATVPLAEVGRMISLVGLGVQTASAILLACLLALLGRASLRHPWFRSWALAFTALSAGLLSLGASFAGAPGALAFLAGYQLGKLTFFLLLLRGAALFAENAAALRLTPRAVAAGVVAGATVSLALAQHAGALIAVQSMLAVPCCALAAVWVGGAPAPRRGMGTRATSGSFLALAVLWTLYLFLYVARPEPARDLPFDWLDALAAYNSYVDLLLQTLLAFGFVLLDAEATRREVTAAHEALGRAHEQLREEAVRDPLTGALNRRAFHEMDPAVLGREGAVVVADIDGLKALNDTRGHQAGDALLRHFVAALRQRLRESDLLYRTGGDEFVLIAPGASAERITDRFSAALAGLPALELADPPLRVEVGVSWGCAAYASAPDLGRALSEADARMYDRKRQRRG